MGVISPTQRLETSKSPVYGRKSEVYWSGWGDSNPRPPRPERGALTKLRYNPFALQKSSAE
jgi:hypothetical protein